MISLPDESILGSGAPANVDSARANLAGTFVNAFVNAGFGNDKLMVEAEEGQSWIYKNKEHGMFSAAASLGVSLLWDTDVGLSQIDKYAYASEDYIKVSPLISFSCLGERADRLRLGWSYVGKWIDSFGSSNGDGCCSSVTF